MKVAAAVLAAALGIAFPASAPLAAEARTDDAADLAAGYLRSVQLESGLFRYEYDFLTGRWSNKDNTVRQAGTAFALAIYVLQRGDEASRGAVELSLAALAERNIPYGEGSVISGDGSLAGASTGATALALAAALLADIDSAPQRDWVRGLLSLQRTDGRFRRSPVDPEAIGYYDGETWLALALLAAKGGGEEVAEALTRSDEGMLQAYGTEADVTFYHWGQLAAAARFGTTGDLRFVDFAAAQSESFLDVARPRVSGNSNSCYSLEGLAASYVLIASDGRLESLRQRVAERIAAELAHNLSIQIQPDQIAIVLRDGAMLHAAELPNFAGAFLNGRQRPQTRIDSTQHCLAALLQLANLGFYRP